VVSERTVDRRAFLGISGLAGGVVLSGGAVVRAVIGLRPTAAGAQATKVELAYPEYPDVVVANLDDLEPGVPIFFDYPQAGQRNMLVKIERPAEEGIGPDGDVVAFSAFCAHMGAPMDTVYNHVYGMLGPCPLHYSTFDLAKSGMTVMGKAVQNLPQVVIALDAGGDIRATGMYGLIYGYAANLMQPIEEAS
jgi:arsenite oxidase small subunit